MIKMLLFFITIFFFVVLSGCSATADPLPQKIKERISRLEWSQVSRRNFESGYEYCKLLNKEFHRGHNDWRLPTIDELRSIIKNCPETELEGKCRISEVNDNLSYRKDYAHKYCNSCNGKKEPQEYSKLILPPFTQILVSRSYTTIEKLYEILYFHYGVDFSQNGGVILIQDGYWTNVVCVRDN